MKSKFRSSESVAHFRRSLRDFLKRNIARANRYFEWTGLRIQILHYYSETPSRRELGATRSAWAKPLTMQGIEWDADAQLSWVSSMTSNFISEVSDLTRFRDITQGNFGQGFGPVESILLHCVIRTIAPRRVVEVGSGVSTMVMMHAIGINDSEGRDRSDMVCVEPFPDEDLRKVVGITLVDSMAQTVPDAVFDQLDSGDLLFVDSTHVVKTGSELTRIYLEVLPNLKPGVMVHIHDIYLPFNFAPDILGNLYDWQETTLVAALLTGNPHLKVLASMSALHHTRSRELNAIFSQYRPHVMPSGLFVGDVEASYFPSSLWLTTQ